MIKITGLEEAVQKFKNLEQAAQRLQSTHQVPLDELFNASFMSKYTNFQNTKEMFNASGFKVKTNKDFESIPTQEWDVFVSRNTKFNNWKEMLDQAGVEYALKELGL